MNKSTRIFSITHEQDVDGLFCGAILKNAFRNTLVFLTNHGYRNMKKAADLLERNVAQSRRPGTVVISDLSLNSKAEAEIMFKCKTIWLGDCLVGPSLLERRNDKKGSVVCQVDPLNRA